MRELLTYSVTAVWIVGNGTSVAPCHVTYLSVDRGHGRGRFAQSKPFNDLFEFGLQSMRLSLVTAPAPGKSGKSIAF